MSALRPGDLHPEELRNEQPVIDHDRGGRIMVDHRKLSDVWRWRRLSNGRVIAYGRVYDTQRASIRSLELVTGGVFLPSMRGPRGRIIAGYLETRDYEGVLLTRVRVDFVTVRS